jgi:predicted ribosome quality control (RQC) complex YloA/Tae2 family protein
MLTNYYTLRHIAGDLNRRLRHAAIDAVFTQERNELVMSFLVPGEGASAGCVVVSCDPGENVLSWRDAFRRAKRNSVELFSSAVGARVQQVSISPGDRRISFSLGTTTIVVDLFGSRANVLLVDDRLKIVAAFLKPRELVGKELEATKSVAVPTTFEDFTHRLVEMSEATTLAAVKRCDPLLGTVAAREVIFRAGLDESALVSHLTQGERTRVFEQYEAVHASLVETGAPRIYYEGNIPRQFAIIPLNHLRELECREFESIHDAVRTFVGSVHKQRSLNNRIVGLQQLLEQQLGRTERTLTKVRDEISTADRTRQYELYGELLKNHLSRIKKGMKQVEVENIFTAEQEVVTIPLESGLSPSRNVERYFDKAKKARHASMEQAGRKAELERRVEVLRRLVDELRRLDSADDFEEYLKEHRVELKSFGVKQEGAEAAKSPEVPFRVFTVAGGFHVWVGKSSDNNDLLTMRYAKPNDLWFHARGSSGSHVVLRTGSGKGEPSKQAIEQAAAIAAYYSKMKHASLVPVAMTEKKFVRKPRGAPAGTVALEREKTIFVEPKLPVDEKPTTR